MKPLSKPGGSELVQRSGSMSKGKQPVDSQIPLAQSTQPKLPLFVRFLSIYDIDKNKYLIQTGNFGFSEIQLDAVLKDCKGVIDKVIKGKGKSGKVVVDFIQSHKGAKDDGSWVTIINDKKIIIAGKLTSSEQ